jgi:hypothetical protein
MIACLGWGSLTWNPGGLPIQHNWFQDGPLLPIEFARHSRGDRITLVIVPGVRYVRSLWTLMTVPDVETGRAQLGQREGVEAHWISKHIGSWSSASPGEAGMAGEIGRWASRLELDGVVWTALPPSFHGQVGRIPTADEVISFLRGLPPERQQGAAEYIRKVPRQIDTEYRRRIEAELSWTPIGSS